MKTKMNKQIAVGMLTLLANSYSIIASAHSAGGPIGAAAGATVVATIECYDDGSGAPQYLFIQIEDGSAPLPGTLVSMQAFKDNRMVNVTDPISGDGVASPAGRLYQGAGTYVLSVNKSGPGGRSINATFHCQTSGGIHTGTSEQPTLFQAE